MSTKRETILAAVQTALAGSSGVSTRIYRSRAQALSRAETPAIVIEPVNDVATHDTAPRLSWQLTFNVVVIERGSIPDQSADDTVSDVHSKIMASATSGLLDPLVVDMVPASVDWEFQDADQTLALITMQFQATYQTDLTTIT